MRRGEDCRIRNNENGELELEGIVKSKSIETLRKLKIMLELKKTSTDPELSDFFQYIDQTTSISSQDSMYLLLVNKILKDKEEQKEIEQQSQGIFK